MRLSPRDYDVLLNAILDLHDRAATGLLLADAPAVLSQLISSDTFAIANAALVPAGAVLGILFLATNRGAIQSGLNERQILSRCRLKMVMALLPAGSTSGSAS